MLGKNAVELQKLVDGVWEFLDGYGYGDFRLKYVDDKITVLAGFAVRHTNNCLKERVRGVTDVRLVQESGAEPDGFKILKYWVKDYGDGWDAWKVIADVTKDV